MAIPNVIDFTAFDTLTAAQLDDLIENDVALADGTALDNNAISARTLATNAITLGYAEITANFGTNATSATQVTGLSASVTIPAGGRRVKVTAFCQDVTCSVTPSDCYLSIWDGTVGSGTQITRSHIVVPSAGYGYSMTPISVKIPAAGAKTYNVGFHVNTGNGLLTAAATYPAFILVEAI